MTCLAPLRTALFLFVLFPAYAVVCAQPAPEADAKALKEQLGKLQADLATLKNPDRPQVLDALMCAEAVDRILRHEEFFKPNFVKDAGKVLELGFARAAACKQGKTNWGREPGKSVLAYRSRVEGSLQPYAVSLPEGYGKEANKRWPLHLVLHGRNGNLTEVSFFASFEGKAADKAADWIQLDVFGRTNNAYRWAGETDVFEALEAVTKRYQIDERRITLHGFSMGGAGAWHLAVHHPDRWSSAGAGAGFVDYYGYQKKEEQLPLYQHQGLHVYDAVDYALNLADVPMITYGGEIDPQLLASRTMEKLAQERGVPLQVLVGPQMGHKFDPESLKTFMAFHAQHAKKGLPTLRARAELKFETWTLKYNRCGWLTILEQDEVYQRSTVESKLSDDGVLIITPENVRALSVQRGVADRVKVGDSEIVDLNQAADANLPDVYFAIVNGNWQSLEYDDSLDFDKNSELHKRHNLQGPIDDAFMEPFLVVRGSGTPWSPEHQKYADWSLGRFEQEYDKWMRGKVPVKSDAELTDEDIAGKNLVLFGDPGSNSVLAKIADRLPMEWTRDGCGIDGTMYRAADHAVVLVYPNPLNPERYVVINTGMTMHEADFKATNAMLFPKLGDMAVLKLTAGKEGFSEEVVTARMFDADWK